MSRRRRRGSQAPTIPIPPQTLEEVLEDWKRDIERRDNPSQPSSPTTPAEKPRVSSRE